MHFIIKLLGKRTRKAGVECAKGTKEHVVAIVDRKVGKTHASAKG